LVFFTAEDAESAEDALREDRSDVMLPSHKLVAVSVPCSAVSASSAVKKGIDQPPPEILARRFKKAPNRTVLVVAPG